jgi:uncharacterized membrane protein
MNQRRELNVRKDPQKGTHEITGKYYEGIIPSPEMMKGYQEIDPSLPLRLVKMTEDEGAHRRQVEMKILANGYKTTTLNTFVGFLALLALAALSYLFMVRGYAVQGAIIASSIGGVIGVFVIGKAISKRRIDRTD